MESLFPLACGMQRGVARNPVGRKPDLKREKVVMISSHPEWKKHHEPEELPADSIDLVRVFHEVLERVRRGPVLSMDDESVTVGQMLDRVCRRLATEEAPVRLNQVLRVVRTERGVICLQLALLELLRLQAIVLRQDPKAGDLLLQKNVGAIR